MKKRLLCILLFLPLLGAALGVPARGTEMLLEEAEISSEAQPAAVLLEEGVSAVQTIAEVNALPPDTPGVSFRGTVVWAQTDRILVQAEDCSLWVQSGQSHCPGEILLVSGQTGQEAFLAETVVVEGTGPLPAMETTLAEAPEELRVLIRGGSLSAGVLTQEGFRVAVQTGESGEGTVDLYGVLLDGIFHADIVLPVSRPSRDRQVYFGLLDAHSNLSDGLGTVQEAFSFAAQVEGLDFFAVTDHSGSLDSAKWAEGKQAAASVTNGQFVGIFGYEMTWGEDKMVGHINTFATDGFLTAAQPGMESLSGYCAALAGLPGQVSQFNHPGIYLGDFGGFRDYDPECDACVQLFELEGEGGESFYSYYIQALDCGWHLAPTVGQDNHHGNWGAEGRSRTAVLTENLDARALYEAMAARRVYATQDPDLCIDYRLNGSPMGTVMGVAQSLSADVALDDPTDGAQARVEVIGTGGAVVASGETDGGSLTLSVPAGAAYYFLRVTQPDGDAAVTAPVWVDDFQDMGIASVTADVENPQTGQTVTLTVELYNWEEIPFEVSGVALYRGGEKMGDFSPAGSARYTLRLPMGTPGEIRLTAVAWGTANGESRRFERELVLHVAAPNTVKATIRQVRDGKPGDAYAVEGYATTGNTNPFTTFCDTIYVQDDTGGIPVRGRFPLEIQVGTPVAVSGILREETGERYLELTECRVPNRAMYSYVPTVVDCREAVDYARRGGTLVQTRGTVVALTSEGGSVSRFTLQDSRGNTAEVVIEPEIRSGSYGTNDLAERVKPGKTVRATGLVAVEKTGQNVLRVRNCDEVVTEEPVISAAVPDLSNPRTGDGGFWRFIMDFLRQTVAIAGKI